MYLHVTACIHGYSQNCWHSWTEGVRLSNCCQAVWFSRRLVGRAEKWILFEMKENAENNSFLSTQGILVLYRSIVVLNLRLKGGQGNFFNRAPCTAQCLQSKRIDSRQTTVFNTSHLHLDNWMVELGMWSLCVCLWSVPLLAWTPSVVGFCSPFHCANLQGWCWHRDHGVSSWNGRIGLVLCHRSFIGCLKLLFSLAGLLQGQVGCKRTCLGGVAFASGTWELG